MLRLTALSLILTMVFAALTFGIVASQRRDLPEGIGSIVFEMSYSDTNALRFHGSDIDLLERTNLLLGDQFDTLIHPATAFQSFYVDGLDCSPDGQSLLVAYQVFYLLNITDRMLKPLTSDPHNIGALAWSHDQKQIAFATEGGQPAIYTANADGSDLVQIFANGELEDSLSWSPDHRAIAFDIYTETDNKIEIIDITSHTIREVYHSGLPIYAVTWSPDGTRIMFERGDNPNSNIYTIQPDGSHLTRLTHNDLPNTDPRWSPDGSLISYSSLDASGHFQLYVMNADGSDPHLIFAAPRGEDAFNLCWLPPQKENS